MRVGRIVRFGEARRVVTWIHHSLHIFHSIVIKITSLVSEKIEDISQTLKNRNKWSRSMPGGPSNSNNTKNTAMRREIFIPFNRKWLADSEYVKIFNLGALIWGHVFIIHPILFPFFCIFMFFSPFLAFFCFREWYHWIQREILHQKHLWYWFICLDKYVFFLVLAHHGPFWI